ncbi:BQ2448_7025 [Microbotryum intermedium]|uniref:BQ2448_7025 protein n=1 Tax=Microbotryum intermedium TaxID=269621 RepID=A0A238FH08_9BASI|nr:BQ2448_7025 [Microbotryum intermedium]
MGILDPPSPFRSVDSKSNRVDEGDEPPAGLTVFSTLLQRFRHPTAPSTFHTPRDRSKLAPASPLRKIKLQTTTASPVASTSTSTSRSESERFESHPNTLLTPTSSCPPRRSSRSSTSPSQAAATTAITATSPSTRILNSLTAASLSRGSSRASPSSPHKKPARTPALKFADPSVYADLDPLTDYLVPGLDLVMCGINPGCQSARTGNHYAHPSNHFYKCLYQSGLTHRRVDPSACRKLIKKASIGLTNLVERPTRQETELKRDEKRAGCANLLAKVEKNRPHFVAFAGLDVGRVFRDYVAAHQGAKRVYTYQRDQGPPPVVPVPVLDPSYDSDDADYFVPKSRTPVKRHQTPREEHSEAKNPLEIKKDEHDVITIQPEPKEEENEDRKPILPSIHDTDIKLKTEPKPLPKDWARDLGLQPIVLSFPPYEKDLEGSTRRTKTYLWLFPSPSGLVRPYQVRGCPRDCLAVSKLTWWVSVQLPDKIEMHARLRETIEAVKRGEDPFADCQDEVHEYYAEVIMGVGGGDREAA